MISYRDAKIRVARVDAGHRFPDNLLAAGEAISDAIRDWNRANCWEFKRSQATVTVPANATSTFVQDLRKVYNIRVVGQDSNSSYTLKHLRRRELNEAIRDQGTNELFGYIPVHSSDGVTIQLIDPTDSEVTLDIYYYEAILQPSTDDDDLDIPEPLIPALITLAKWHYVSNKTDSADTIERWRRDGLMELQRAINDDRGQPDEAPRLRPRIEWRQAFYKDEWDDGYYPS